MGAWDARIEAELVEEERARLEAEIQTVQPEPWLTWKGRAVKVDHIVGSSWLLKALVVGGLVLLILYVLGVVLRPSCDPYTEIGRLWCK